MLVLIFEGFCSVMMFLVVCFGMRRCVMNVLIVFMSCIVGFWRSGVWFLVMVIEILCCVMLCGMLLIFLLSGLSMKIVGRVFLIF